MLAGHEGDVWFSVFAPDGQTVATGGNDLILRLWDPQTGTQRATLAAPRELRAAAYFPDGKRLATGCANGVVQIWDVPQTRPIVTLKNNPRMIRALAVAPDGKTLAVSSNAQTLILYDTMTWAELRSLPAQEEPILGLAFSPDGKSLAMSTGHTPQGGVGSVKLLDPTSLEAQTVLPLRYDVRSVAFSPDGKLLATTSLVAPDPVQVWDLSTAMPVRALKPARFVWKLDYAPDGATLAVGQTDGIISLFDPATGRLLASSQGHAAVIFGLDFSPDGKLLATASADATVKLWDVPATTGTAEKK
jgi:WD40 repeat protein